MNKDNFKAYLAWFSICIIWGTTYLAIRVGVKDMPPLLFAGMRWIIAGPIFLLVLKLRGYKLPDKKDLKHIAVVGILLLGLGNGLVAFAERFSNNSEYSPFSSTKGINTAELKYSSLLNIPGYFGRTETSFSRSVFFIKS